MEKRDQCSNAGLKSKLLNNINHPVNIRYLYLVLLAKLHAQFFTYMDYQVAKSHKNACIRQQVTQGER